MKITKVLPVGKKECFCISTDTGKYKLNGIEHHNSVNWFFAAHLYWTRLLRGVREISLTVEVK